MSNFLETKVKIGSTDIKWLNRLTLKDVVIEDQKGNTILDAGNLTAGFKLWDLIKGKYILTTVRLFGFTCHITKENPESKTNIQFIIDKLSGGNNNNSSIELQINSILIRRGNIKYDVLSKGNTKKQFNPNHIDVNNISGKIALNIFTKDSLNLQISKLGFEETSGFKVEKMATNIIGSKDSVHIDKLLLKLPHSLIDIPTARIQFNNNKDSLPNALWQQPIDIYINDSKISPIDFKAFTPSLENFSDEMLLSANISGYINSISLSKVTLKYGSDMSFTGNMDLKGLANKNEELYLFGQVKQLYITTAGVQKISNNFSKKNIKLPDPIMQLGDINFNGEISGFIDQLVAYGNLQSSIGSLQMDVFVGNDSKRDTVMHLKGKIASSDLEINKLFDEGNPFGKARFNAEVDLSQQKKQKMTGTIQAQINEFEYKGYSYEDIFLSGNFKKDNYEGLLHINDQNGKVEIQGQYKIEDKIPVFDFMANVSNIHPDKLHLTNKYENPDISLGINANFKGNNADDFEGYIAIEDMNFYTAKDSFNINNIRLETSSEELPERRIKISSDILNGEIKGQYSFASLLSDLYNTTELYLPSLIQSINKNEKPSGNNKFDMFLTIENTEHLSNALKLPFTIIQNATLTGHYDSHKNSLTANVDLPKFKIGNTTFENGTLNIENPTNKIDLQLKATQFNKKNIHNYINIASNASEDRINTTVTWSNNMEEKFNASINASTLFVTESEGNKSKLRTEITIPESDIILKDSLWKIEPSSITVTDGKIYVDNFYLTKENQHLHINGIVSNSTKETLLVDLKDIELSYIFDVINIQALQFGGRATGTVQGHDLLGSMMIDCRLDVQDFSFNDAVQGRLKLTSEWDNNEQGILLLGSIYKNDTTWTDVNGYIYPIGEKQGLSLFFDAKEINIAFMQKYLNAFASDISGTGYGDMHIYGSFSNIFIEGHPYIKDGNIKINLLNTSYKFSDSIYVEKYAVKTKNLTLYDTKGNKGLLNLTFSHKNFRDLKYDLNVIADKILVYDITERMNPEMYGSVYASGTAQIKGTEEQIDVDGNVRSEEGTSIGFNFMENTTAENYDFITFLDKLSNDNSASSKNDDKSSSIKYQLNFLVNVTPEAKIEFVMDPISGDKIKGNGNGNLQVEYGSQSDMQMFGNYIITNGSYNFSLQQVIRKLFRLRDGSTVSFQGDPMKANLNINAAYYLTANIQDLDETLMMETANYSSVPVNCLLSLNGQLQNPTISFDIEFPNSSSELERKVKSFIDTEDMMTRQIIYLLVLNKFYTPDYSRNEYRSNEFSTMASSAISSQLSNILSSLTDKVQIGTNIRSRQDGVKDTEVEMLLSSQLLNNRLLFNGNFGYKDNYIQSNAFIGEFDLEYKLTRSGGIRLKAYNHANDLYRYNTKSLTRQGVGIMFQKDFTKLSEFLLRKKKKKQTESQEDTSETQTGH